MREPRVLMVTANYLPVMGGVETHVAETAPRLRAMGLDIRVLTTDLSGALPTQATIDGVPVTRVPAWRPTGDLHIAPGLVAAIHAHQPDIVHVQGYHTLVPAAAMIGARRARVPWVVTFHSGGHASSMRTRLRSAQVLVQRPLLTRAKALVAVSPFEAELFASRIGVPRGRISVIPNGARRPRPLPDPAADGHEPGAMILSIGRLERYKGHDHAISAMPLILAARPDAALRILGRGPDHARLVALSRALGIADRVRIDWIPAGDGAAMDRALGESHVVLALSEYESQGLAAVDAISAGRRVVVAERAALVDLVDRGWAAPVRDPSDPAATAVAVLEALEAPVPASVPADLPSWDDCAAALASLYARVQARPA